MAKEKTFVRVGAVVAFRQSDFQNWWTVLPTDAEPSQSIQVFVGDGNESPTVLENLITVLQKIQKASK